MRFIQFNVYFNQYLHTFMTNVWDHKIGYTSAVDVNYKTGTRPPCPQSQRFKIPRIESASIRRRSAQLRRMARGDDVRGESDLLRQRAVNELSHRWRSCRRPRRDACAVAVVTKLNLVSRRMTATFSRQSLAYSATLRSTSVWLALFIYTTSYDGITVCFSFSFVTTENSWKQVVMLGTTNIAASNVYHCR